MSARANSLKSDDLYGATIEMVCEMVRRAESKLSSLQSHRTHIRRRIQALHHLSRALVSKTATSQFEDFALETGHPVEEHVPDGFEQQASLRRSERAAHKSDSSALRRACRIALMETDEAESCAQILQRITRRQSVSLKSYAESVQEVTTELNRMVAEDEAITFLTGDTQQWQLNRSNRSTEPHMVRR